MTIATDRNKFVITLVDKGKGFNMQAQDKAKPFKDDIINMRRKQLNDSNEQFEVMTQAYKQAYWEALFSTQAHMINFLAQNPGEQYKETVISDLNKQLLAKCGALQNRCQQAVAQSDQAVDDLKARLGEANRRIADLGGNPVDPPTEAEENLAALRQARKQVSAIPVPQLTKNDLKKTLKALAIAQSRNKQSLTTDELRQLFESQEATAGEQPGPASKPTEGTGAKVNVAEKDAGDAGDRNSSAANALNRKDSADAELDRVLKAKGLNKDFKDARLSTIMIRIAALVQPTTVTFDVSDDVSTLRVTIMVADKTVQEILDEAARKVGGKIVKKDNAIKIVGASGGKNSADDKAKQGNDAARIIRDLIGH